MYNELVGEKFGWLFVSKLDSAFNIHPKVYDILWSDIRQSFHERCWINHQRQEYFLVLIGASEADHLKYHPFHFVMILSHTNEFSIHHNQSCSPNSHHIYPAFDSANFVCVLSDCKSFNYIMFLFKMK